MTLSVCLIVKDEEQVLERCLTSAKKFADEIIVVDTGSSDKTVNIAENLADKVYSFDWCDDFSAARNFSFSKAECEFIMWLDADDVVSDENARKIIELKETMKNYDVAFLLYAVAFDEDAPTFFYYRERIVRRSLGLRWEGAVHEVIEPCGRIIYSDACIWHKKIKESSPLRNLNIYQKMISRGKKLVGREKFYYGRELYFNGMYEESIAVLKSFLAGEGWAENKSEACITLYYAYTILGEDELALSCLMKGFTIGFPKSQACCILADHFMKFGDLDSAEFWYKIAATLPQNVTCGAFVNQDFSGFVPYMQLCVLYDRKGDLKKACRYNELAGSIKPHNQSYLQNKKYFEDKLGR